MNPRLIVAAANKDDIRLAVKYAREQKIALAVRTGGHQYSGASSTAAPNILLDLANTFTGPGDLVYLPKKTPDDGRSFVYTSVSHTLDQFNHFLGKNGLFVPHGQCSHVRLGGHVQTGGYGQLARSFGLFGDHVRTLEIIDSEGNDVEVTKGSDPDLFWAILGGSPGNFGVLTHITLEVHRNEDYDGAIGLKALFLYDKQQLVRLVGKVAEMAEDPEWPRNYDLCVSVLSSSFPLGQLMWPGLDESIKHRVPSVYGDDKVLGWPKTIIVYAQWVPMTKGEKADDKVMQWFQNLKKGSNLILSDGIMKKPMSELTRKWLFMNVREFPLPYVKRTYLTNSTTLTKDHWPEWVSDRIDEVVGTWDNKLWLSCQIQCFGGKYSMFTRNADNGTAYSWRKDTTVVQTLDCFHWSVKRDAALDWQKQNDQTGIGRAGIFSKEDRRVLWGSYGDFDLDKVWKSYYEDEAKYRKLGEIRARVDPDGIFTPNTFAVKRASTT
ncbi:uncharacterized protein HMPREF1541_02534 [Cyphellophora europaea CBS 101466]|uniref:FAD-binding PCMH-type domain-containing protein n=1 Tax=Cyphellophora europaea (strain CBS 101466) TaxID=1220924 RepID=W2S475_CYPE1|nr:uncharacterized protein HMPREF1541_02534 [Cyphellophora europaea CBS 101466]ETN43375.1 hypothetical protein HMPREF1541_02534 [Cyphellophora europaea CBS 101466]